MVRGFSVALAFLGAIVLSGTNALADSLAETGEKVFKRQCAACHTVETGKNRVGPSLAGVIGRAAAATPGFKYSDSMKEAKITWTDDKLESYVENPKVLVPKGTMAFVGLKKADERAAVIAYLKKEAGGK